jgi:hypothetical protein
VGLLRAWLYPEAELTLDAVEINVVRECRLWPRSIAPPPSKSERRERTSWPGSAMENDREKTTG